jgi:enoyl-CoA hydratase/carnithine racemase
MALVLTTVSDGVGTLTLNNPDERNTLTAPMVDEIVAAVDAFEADESVGAIVVTGTPPAFCAGADMSAAGDTFAAPDPSTFSAAAVHVPAWQVRKPVIAAVNGHAIGIGFTLTLQCDLRFFAADAKYGIVQVRRGVMGDGYSHWTLPRIVGMANAAEILLTGRMFDGHEALRLGVCSRVLPNDEVLPAALELAHDIAANTAPLSVAYSKALLWETWSLDAAGVEARETEYHHHLMGSPDAREGVVAFLERREPHWQGRVSDEWRGPAR